MCYGIVEYSYNCQPTLNTPQLVLLNANPTSVLRVPRSDGLPVPFRATDGESGRGVSKCGRVEGGEKQGVELQGVRSPPSSLR